MKNPQAPKDQLCRERWREANGACAATGSGRRFGLTPSKSSIGQKELKGHTGFYQGSLKGGVCEKGSRERSMGRRWVSGEEHRPRLTRDYRSKSLFLQGKQGPDHASPDRPEALPTHCYDSPYFREHWWPAEFSWITWPSTGLPFQVWPDL